MSLEELLDWARATHGIRPPDGDRFAERSGRAAWETLGPALEAAPDGRRLAAHAICGIEPAGGFPEPFRRAMEAAAAQERDALADAMLARGGDLYLASGGHEIARGALGHSGSHDPAWGSALAARIVEPLFMDKGAVAHLARVFGTRGPDTYARLRAFRALMRCRSPKAAPGAAEALRAALASGLSDADGRSPRDKDALRRVLAVLEFGARRPGLVGRLGSDALDGGINPNARGLARIAARAAALEESAGPASALDRTNAYGDRLSAILEEMEEAAGDPTHVQEIAMAIGRGDFKAWRYKSESISFLSREQLAGWAAERASAAGPDGTRERGGAFEFARADGARALVVIEDDPLRLACLGRRTGGSATCQDWRDGSYRQCLPSMVADAHRRAAVVTDAHDRHLARAMLMVMDGAGAGFPGRPVVLLQYPYGAEPWHAGLLMAASEHARAMGALVAVQRGTLNLRGALARQARVPPSDNPGGQYLDGAGEIAEGEAGSLNVEILEPGPMARPGGLLVAQDLETARARLAALYGDAGVGRQLKLGSDDN